MARLAYVVAPLLVFVLASCAHKPVQPAKITDIRLDTNCPVHDAPLIEATNSVDPERGSYMGSYYKIRKALFPYAFNDPFSDGEMARVTYCPKCRAAKAKYLRDSKAMPHNEFMDMDVDDFIERQRRELDAEYSKK